jgi:ABC-type lipopolysaccharide export system ATPase subunit
MYEWAKGLKMKLSHDNLKKLIRQEMGSLLLEQPAAGVDTSAVQQSGKVTQVLRIIDGMREDEIGALLTAMKSAGLPIAM